MRQYVGTDELAGATVVEVGWNELTLAKDGRKLVLSLEEEWDVSCLCEGVCTCSPSTYLRAEEVF